MVVTYGEDEARALFALTNTVVVFGGGKDVQFYRELSALLDDVRISRQTVTDGAAGVGTTRSGEDVRILRPGDIRRIRERHALVIAGAAPPIIARLRRCVDGRDGRLLLAEQAEARTAVRAAWTAAASAVQRQDEVLTAARLLRLVPRDRASSAPVAEPSPDGADDARFEAGR
jgi:type IV secretion system protein VirD4